MKLEDALSELERLQRESLDLRTKLTTAEKQIKAYRLLQDSMQARLTIHRSKRDEYESAILTLDSEREANARLTEENERLRNLLNKSN